MKFFLFANISALVIVMIKKCYYQRYRELDSLHVLYETFCSQMNHSGVMGCRIQGFFRFSDFEQRPISLLSLLKLFTYFTSLASVNSCIIFLKGLPYGLSAKFTAIIKMILKIASQNENWNIDESKPFPTGKIGSSEGRVLRAL